MAAITYDRFDGGLDRRRSRPSQDANRLWVLENAFINNGGKIVKRPGLRLFTVLTPGTVGLRSVGGRLATVSRANIGHSHPEMINYIADRDATSVPTRLHFMAMLNGFPYVVVEYGGFDWDPLLRIRHLYLDNTPSPRLVTDANCPHTVAAVVVNNAVFAVRGEVVRHSAPAAPRNWSTGGAGFLPTGGNSAGATVATALSEFQGEMAVLFEDGGQIWHVDPDPTRNTLRQRLSDVGTLWPRSHATISGDVIYLTPWGFRSIGVSSMVDNIREADVGMPIDTMVAGRYTAGQRVIAERYGGGGQYWCVIDREVWVYSYSRLAKISAWSRYTLPFLVDDMCSHKGQLYLRSGDNVFIVDASAHLDNGVPFTVIAETAFLDAKRPGVLKQWVGIDIAQDGRCDVSFLYDQNDWGLATVPVGIVGTTHAGGTVPVELCSVSLALRFTVSNNLPWQLDAFTLYHESLGLVA